MLIHIVCSLNPAFDDPKIDLSVPTNRHLEAHRGVYVLRRRSDVQRACDATLDLMDKLVKFRVVGERPIFC